MRISNEQLIIFRLSLVSTQWVLAAKISWAISYGPYHMGKQSVNRRWKQTSSKDSDADKRSEKLWTRIPVKSLIVCRIIYHSICVCERNGIRIMTLLTIFSLKLCSILTFFAAYHFKWPLLLCNSPPIDIVD